MSFFSNLFGQTEKDERPAEERAIEAIDKYFHYLSHLQFTKAKDFSKSRKCTDIPGSFGKLFRPLQFLASSEGIYYSLSYLEQRVISRTHLEEVYTEVLSDLNKIGRDLSQESDIDDFFYGVIFDIGILSGIRCEMISFYRSIAGVNINYNALIDSITSIVTHIEVELNHPLFIRIKQNVLAEAISLLKLLKAQTQITDYNFKDSLFYIYQAKSKLNEIIEEYKNPVDEEASQDQTRFRPEKAGLFFWLYNFLQVLTAKYALYFNNQLRGDSDTDLSHRGKGVPPSLLYGLYIQQYCHKSDCYSVGIFVDVEDIRYSPDGYRCYDSEASGHGGFDIVPVYQFPPNLKNEYYDICVPCVDNLIHKKKEYLQRQRAPAYIVENQYSYFISQVDKRVYLVLIYKKNKKQKDQMTNDFIYNFSVKLRCWDIFSKIAAR